MNDDISTKQKILAEFSTWDPEKQMSEYLAYKGIGSYSPFDESELRVMQLILENNSVDLLNENYEPEEILNEAALSSTLKMDDFKKIFLLFNTIFVGDNIINFDNYNPSTNSIDTVQNVYDSEVEKDEIKHYIYKSMRDIKKYNTVDSLPDFFFSKYDMDVVYDAEENRAGIENDKINNFNIDLENKQQSSDDAKLHKQKQKEIFDFKPNVKSRVHVGNYTSAFIKSVTKMLRRKYGSQIKLNNLFKTFFEDLDNATMPITDVMHYPIFILLAYSALDQSYDIALKALPSFSLKDDETVMTKTLENKVSRIYLDLRNYSKTLQIKHLIFADKNKDTFSKKVEINYNLDKYFDDISIVIKHLESTNKNAISERPSIANIAVSSSSLMSELL